MVISDKFRDSARQSSWTARAVGHPLPLHDQHPQLGGGFDAEGRGRHDRSRQMDHLLHGQHPVSDAGVRLDSVRQTQQHEDKF